MVAPWIKKKRRATKEAHNVADAAANAPIEAPKAAPAAPAPAAPAPAAPAPAAVKEAVAIKAPVRKGTKATKKG
jgi:hypothetical protein